MSNFQQVSSRFYIGLSTDTKPTGIIIGSTAYAYDTKATYITHDGNNWVVFTPLTGIGFADSAALDASGRLRVSNPINIFTASFQYNIHPLYFEQITANNGTITHKPSFSAAQLDVTTDNGSKAVMQTYEYFRYQEGKSEKVDMTWILPSQQAGTKMQAGYNDDENGWFFEVKDADTVQFVRRTKTSGSVVDNVVLQAAWNRDKMDGTGSSGVTLDFTKGQILRIDLQWLSQGRIRMCWDVGGQVILAHEFLIANILSVPSTTTANLPIRWLIENTSAVSSAKTMYAICCSVATEGGDETELGHTFQGGNEKTLRTGIGTTLVPICSVRPATTLNSITNRIKWELEDIEVFANDSMYWQLIYLPSSITGATWAVGPVTHSATEVDIAGTAIAGGIVIASGYVAANNRAGIAGRQLRTKFPFTLDAAGTGQTRSYSIAVATLGGTNKSAAGTFNWVEVR